MSSSRNAPFSPDVITSFNPQHVPQSTRVNKRVSDGRGSPRVDYVEAKINQTGVIVSPCCAWCYANYVETVNHHLRDCSRFRDLHSEEKQRFISAGKLCPGCLESGHWVRECDLRPSRCSSCKRSHHELVPCGINVSFRSAGGSSLERRESPWEFSSPSSVQKP